MEACHWAPSRSVYGRAMGSVCVDVFDFYLAWHTVLSHTSHSQHRRMLYVVQHYYLTFSLLFVVVKKGVVFFFNTDVYIFFPFSVALCSL